jgi:alpha-methylacyl-CoA racemase
MLGTIVQWVRAGGQIDGPLASAFHDSPFYDVYRCTDGGCITLAALARDIYQVDADGSLRTSAAPRFLPLIEPGGA